MKPAFEDLVETYQSEILTYLWRFFHNAEDAEDCLQDTFLKAFAAYDRFMAGEPLIGGAYTEIGTDLEGGARIEVSGLVGHLRAWGVRDGDSRRVLLGIDNAQHTWAKAVAMGETQ